MVSWYKIVIFIPCWLLIGTAGGKLKRPSGVGLG